MSKKSDLSNVYKILLSFGLLLVLCSAYFQSWAISLGVLAGVVIAAVNLRLIQRSVGGLLAAGEGSMAGVYLVKMAGLLLTLFLLIKVVGLDAVGIAVGYSALVAGLVAGGQSVTVQETTETGDDVIEAEHD